MNELEEKLASNGRVGRKRSYRMDSQGVWGTNLDFQGPVGGSYAKFGQGIWLKFQLGGVFRTKITSRGVLKNRG